VQATQEGDAQTTQGAVARIRTILELLAKLYPAHIEKEDRRFFPAAMEYLSDQEQAAMLDEFWEFDKRLIHEKYRSVVAQLQGEGGPSGSG